MMKRFILSVIFGAMLLTPAQADVEVSLLTCEPGDMLYTLFGHTAIRLKGDGDDVVFNYGTFNFNTPHFYLKFAKGLLPYQLSAQTYESFESTYRHMNVSVYEQHLDLDSVQKSRLTNALWENYRPENRSYLYNFLFDNCATRVRDIFEETLYIRWNTEAKNLSFWNMLDLHLEISPWVMWGIHSILGDGGNAIATARQEMFLPERLMEAAASASSGSKPLVSETVKIIDAPRRSRTLPWYFSPFFVFSVCTVILIAATLSAGIRCIKTLSVPLFAASGALGCLITFLAFTEHPITFPNWNILWAFPINILMPVFLFSDKYKKCVKYYLNAYMGLLLAQLPIVFFSQPAIPYATLPLIVLMFYFSYRIAANG